MKPLQVFISPFQFYGSFDQTGRDWPSSSHIPSSVEAEVVVAEVGLPLVPDDPVVGCFVQSVPPPLTTPCDTQGWNSSYPGQGCSMSRKGRCGEKDRSLIMQLHG